MTATTQDTLPIPEPRTGIRVRTPRRGAPDPVVFVDAEPGLVVLDITDHNGTRTQLLLHRNEARELGAVLQRHAKEGRY